MRVGLLPHASLARPNGVNRYVRSLVSELPDVDVVAAPHGPGRSVRSAIASRLRRSSTALPNLNRSVGRLADYDVIHIPYERLASGTSLRGSNVVATVMGLGGLAGANPAPDALRYDTEFVDAIRHLDDVAFITPSNATRNVLCDLIGVDPSCVTVIPLGVDHHVFTPSEPSTAPTTRPAERPYVLHVGPYSLRKNSQLLLEAFASSIRLGSCVDTLVWAGPVAPRTILREASRLGIADQVIVAGQLSDQDLAAAYRGAAALCFPSRYEGFGLPVLEAMACGTPVIISDCPALVEVAGDAAVVVPSTCEPPELAAAINQVVDSDGTRQALSTRGRARASSFTWAACARRHAELYRRAAGGHDAPRDRYCPPQR